MNYNCPAVSKIDKIQFESNSQHILHEVHQHTMLCQRSIKYNLKAIHNGIRIAKFRNLAVSKIDKIQFESNSQPHRLHECISNSCVKDR